MAMKKSRATRSAPDCSLRPLQAMMGMAWTSISQQVVVLSASLTPKSLSEIRALGEADVGLSGASGYWSMSMPTLSGERLMKNDVGMDNTITKIQA